LADIEADIEKEEGIQGSDACAHWIVLSRLPMRVQQGKATAHADER